MAWFILVLTGSVIVVAVALTVVVHLVGLLTVADVTGRGP